MAIYTTFFLAKPDELPGGFPTWKPPLIQPIRREIRNPFTKQLVTIETREPDWPEEKEKSSIPQYRATSIKGSYEDYLEGRLPTFVRAVPHWAAKGLTEVELEPLLSAARIATPFDIPRYAPPSSGAALRGFPPGFIPKLIEIDQAEVAKVWAAEMSTPKHTHTMKGKKLSDGWTTDQALQLLKPIAALARQAIPGQDMYLLIEA
jgi:hypothetical protein